MGLVRSQLVQAYTSAWVRPLHKVEPAPPPPPVGLKVVGLAGFEPRGLRPGEGERRIGITFPNDVQTIFARSEQVLIRRGLLAAFGGEGPPFCPPATKS